MLSIEEFSTILVKDQERSYNVAVEIPNPAWHDLQVEAQRHFAAKEKQLAVEQREWVGSPAGKKPPSRCELTPPMGVCSPMRVVHPVCSLLKS